MAQERKFVSRAGYKLDHALEAFKIDVTGNVCADLGCSTGGFTDCLLQRGAKRVYAVDTGYGVLDWKLRNDARVIVLEKQNALHVELPELIDFIVIDVGWTPQARIVPVALRLLKPGGSIVSLMKPHYEATKQLRKGKIPESVLPEIMRHVTAQLEKLGAKVTDTIQSPLIGEKGSNIEFLILLKKV